MFTALFCLQRNMRKVSQSITKLMINSMKIFRRLLQMDDNKKLTEVIKVIAEKEVCGKTFRVYNTPENPLFLAKDVAQWLGYVENKNMAPSMCRYVDENEKVKATVRLPWGNSYKRQNAWFLTEEGLYEVTMQSRLPKAKQFKKEVKKMLKQIRLTGGYIPTNANMADDKLMAKAYEIAQRTINMRVNQLN